MALASSLRKVAQKVIKQFGGSVTVRFVTPGAYNTTTGSITESTSDSAIQGVLDNVNIREVNELVQASDRKLIIAAADVATVPNTEDRAVISSVSYQIIQVQTIEQDNTAIVYELILRT